VNILSTRELAVNGLSVTESKQVKCVPLRGIEVALNFNLLNARRVTVKVRNGSQAANFPQANVVNGSKVSQ
jgi:hypothetical protein